MALSRRLLIKGIFGTVALPVPTVGKFLVQPIGNPAGADRVSGDERLSMTRFESFLNSAFYIRTGDGLPRRVVLAEVTAHSSTTVFVAEKWRQQESFAVLFEGRADAGLPQEVYSLGNPQFGSFLAFLVPVGHGADKARYQAVFNRLV